MNEMSRCLTCQAALFNELKWEQLFSFKGLAFDCLCLECRSNLLPFVRKAASCTACGRIVPSSEIEVPAAAGKSPMCFDCVRWLTQYPVSYLKHESLFDYNESFREWLYRYKYQADQRQRAVVSQRLRDGYKQWSSYQWLILPSSEKSLEERGFHATASLLDEAEIPYQMPFVYIGDGRKQAKKDRKDRVLMQQPFELVESELLQPSSNRWLIFDDVYTTGTTLLKAKIILYENWDKLGYPQKDLDVMSLSLARESSDKRTLED